MPKYLPPAQRHPDTQYRDLLLRLINQGRSVPTRQGPNARTLMQQSMAFDLTNGFPLITDRSLAGFWRKPIGELCAFINGATTLEELETFGCDWWGPWATEAKTGKLGLATGEIGPGSYGGAFRHFPDPDRGIAGPGFDQFAHLVQQIKKLPDLRTHFISPWIPQWNARAADLPPQTTISPCHGWVHVRVIQDELHLHMIQRSGDVPVGVPSNMVQYAALLLMLEHLTGYPARGFYHTISDAHVYEDQIAKAVNVALGREARTLPTVTLNTEGLQVTDIHDFRAEHFDLADYDPHPPVPGIPVAP